MQANEELKIKNSKIEESVVFYQNQIDQLSELYKNKIKEKEKILLEEKNSVETNKTNEGSLKKVINEHLATISNYKKQNEMYLLKF